MKITASLAAAIVALTLTGCSVGSASIPDSWVSLIENEAATAPPPPAECKTKGDPIWEDLPERDVLRDEAARNARTNKDRFRELAGRRRVCAAGLVAPAKKQPTS